MYLVHTRNLLAPAVDARLRVPTLLVRRAGLQWGQAVAGDRIADLAGALAVRIGLATFAGRKLKQTKCSNYWTICFEKSHHDCN